ncbi:MAG: TRAP transporter large permease, partial [Deltaproteobacteria bacterium]|nr:TRAP transporter large permease [Deltaproteobacteria bacterium]
LSVGCAFIFWPEAFGQFAFTPFGKIYSIVLVAVPLFVFMAEMIVASKTSSDAYDAAYDWFGPLPGGLAVASTAVAGIFAATCGAAAGAIASIGKISITEMIERGYDKRLAVGSVASGSTVAELIPPSIFMILIGVISETSIGKLFIAGIIPGILQLSLFSIYIILRSKINPAFGPPAVGITWKAKLTSFYKILPLTSLVVLLFGGLYTGFATPTEVAATGAVGSIAIAALYKKLTWEVFQKSIFNTVRITCFIMWILFAAAIFSQIFTKMGVPAGLCDWMLGLEVSKYVVLVIINLILILLGCFIDPAGIILITIPIFMPIMIGLGFDPIWFGVIFVINMELALLTPPLGLNVFVVKAVLDTEGINVSFGEIVRAIVPFLLLVVLLIVILTIFPDLVTWLPGKMIV